MSALSHIKRHLLFGVSSLAVAQKSVLQESIHAVLESLSDLKEFIKHSVLEKSLLYTQNLSIFPQKDLTDLQLSFLIRFYSHIIICKLSLSPLYIYALPDFYMFYVSIPKSLHHLLKTGHILNSLNCLSESFSRSNIIHNLYNGHLLSTQCSHSK